MMLDAANAQCFNRCMGVNRIQTNLRIMCVFLLYTNMQQGYVFHQFICDITVKVMTAVQGRDDKLLFVRA